MLQLHCGVKVLQAPLPLPVGDGARATLLHPDPNVTTQKTRPAVIARNLRIGLLFPFIGNPALRY